LSTLVGEFSLSFRCAGMLFCFGIGQICVFFLDEREVSESGEREDHSKSEQGEIAASSLQGALVSAVEGIEVELGDAGEDLQKAALFSITFLAEVSGEGFGGVAEGGGEALAGVVGAGVGGGVWFAVEDEGEDAAVVSGVEGDEVFNLLVDPF